MARGGELTKAVFKGEHDTFMVIVESEEIVEQWRKDSSIPMSQVADSFEIFTGNGAQGILERPSKQQLESEFGSVHKDDIVKKIITEGKLETTKSPVKQGDRNQTNANGGGR